MYLPKPVPVDELRIVFEEPTDSSVEIYDINVEIYACFSYLGNWFHIISIFYGRYELFSYEQMGVQFYLQLSSHRLNLFFEIMHIHINSEQIGLDKFTKAYGYYFSAWFLKGDKGDFNGYISATTTVPATTESTTQRITSTSTIPETTTQEKTTATTTMPPSTSVIVETTTEGSGTTTVVETTTTAVPTTSTVRGSNFVVLL